MTTKSQPSRNVLMGILHIALILFFATQLHSCTDEHTDHPTPNGEEKTITFSVKVPGGFTPATYALTTDDENAVNTVDVLLFNTSDGNYISGPHYGSIEKDPVDNSKANVTIRIPENASNYDMVVLANCRSDINGKDFTNDNKTDALAKLIWSVKADKSKPNWLETDGKKTIPMWGEFTSGTVNLTRMLARVNVTNNASASFTLTSVHLCNYRDAGNIAPTSTIPAPNQTGFANAIPYSGGTVISGNKCINEIYTFEAATADTYNVNNPCLVIGGTYGGKTNYYRVDFVKKEANDTYTYLNLLRNHKYEVEISNISGPGYADADKALASRPINVVYDVKDWDESGMTDVVYNGQYMLGVSQSSFLFDNSARTASSTDNTLFVTTNYSGWTAVISEQSSPNWLSITKAETSVQLTFDSNLGGGASSRTAKIKITAGNLEYVVNVTQTTDEVGLKIRNASNQDITELVFAAPDGETPVAQTLNLSWNPALLPVFYTAAGSYSNYNFDGTTVPAFGQVLGGSAQIEVTAAAGSATPTKDKPLTDPINSATITYLDANGDKPVSRTLTLKQQVWDFFMSNQSGADLPHQSTLSFESLTNLQPDAQTITIAFPANSTDVSASNVEGYTITQTALNLGAGTATYTIQPNAKSTAVTNETKSVDFTVTYGGLSSTKTLSLSQTAVVPYFNYTLPTNSTNSNFRNGVCYLNGSTYAITIDTNVPWKITSITARKSSDGSSLAPGTLLSSGTISDLQNKTGGAGQTSVTLTATGTSSAPTQQDGTVTITFAPQTPGQFSDVQVELSFAGVYSKGYTDGTSSNLEWSGSNIYWVESSPGSGSGYLTFDAPDKVQTVTTGEQKQGVFFKWGSLYGISPSLTNGATTDGRDFSSSTKIYTPWGTETTTASWSNILPFSTSIALDELNNYLYYLTDDVSTASSQSAKYGDICRWIDLMNWGPMDPNNQGQRLTGWRMPTANEFKTDNASQYEKVGATWTDLTTVAGECTDEPTNNRGLKTIAVGRTNNNNTADKPFYPAAGCRYDIGRLSTVGSAGLYWSGSPDAGYARNLNFNASNPVLSLYNRSFGCSVRCVRDI